MAEETTIRSIRRSKSKSRRLAKIILLPVGLVFLVGGLYGLIMYSVSALAGLDMVAVVSWEQAVSCPAWSFQREYAVYTDRQCMIIPIVNEGDRVSKGLEVARLNFSGESILNESSNRRLYSPVAGIVSFAPDGLELVSELRDYQALTVLGLEERISLMEPAQKESQGIAAIIQEKIRQEGQEGQETDSDPPSSASAVSGGPASETGPASQEKTLPKEVGAGEAAMKVTDNLSDCYVYMRFPDQEEPPFLQTDQVKMRLAESGGGGEGRGAVLQCEEIPGGWGVLLRLESGLEALRRQRRHQLVIILGTEERFAVPLGAVVMKNGELGIYAEEKNKIRWKPVSVAGERDGLQIIEGLEPGDIRRGDLVVTRPWLVWDGMRLRG